MGDDELRGRQRELAILDGLVNAARTGRSEVLVLRGEAGVGKSALIDSLVARNQTCTIARTIGIESEMELAYSGLHQLCQPFLPLTDRLPQPQQNALGIAFGQLTGSTPDLFLTGLAVLNLLSEAAGQQPVLCVIDDAQWLDLMSARILAFVARRLAAESVVMLFAVRDGLENELTGLTELEISDLDETAARALLDTVLPGPIDPQVRDRIVAETRGNPLALLELPQSWSTTEPTPGSLAGRIEDSFVRRLQPLPDDTKLLLLTAAAEPLGDATLLWRAAERLDLGADPATPAIASGLITFGQRVQFRHPLVRSAAYRMASPQQRQAAHQALADVTDPSTDPDRRAWHRAQATPRPDEEVAAELERSADRARARGGYYAAASFLERAAELTPEPSRRADRALAAATAKRRSGALDDALTLLGSVSAGPPDALRTAQSEQLRGLIAFDQGHAREATDILLDAARQLETLDATNARTAHLEAMTAAIWSGGPDVLALAAAAPRRTEADLLQALAQRVLHGYAAAAPDLTKALAADQTSTEAGIIALDLWEFDTALELAIHQEQTARATGALVQLQLALNTRANLQTLTGDLTAVTGLVEEARQIATATGNQQSSVGALLLESFRGNEAKATDLIEATTRAATEREQGRMVAFAQYARSVLCNGLGQYDAARDAARRVFEQDVIGYGVLVAGELAEAASRTGDTKLVESTLAWLTERTTATPTDWGLGIEARTRALLDSDEEAYRESIERLGRTPLRVEIARSHLLYGEWLRREGRRVDAREQLRTAHELFTELGLEAFAERARHELLATGETVRKRSLETSNDLTAQEAQIAGLARDGHTNPEIAAQLFISPRTVEWHLRKTFAKLGITSRRQLRTALS